MVSLRRSSHSWHFFLWQQTLTPWLHSSHKCASVCACFKTYWVEWPSWRSVIPCAIPSPTWDLQGWERGIRSTTEAPGCGYYYSAGTDWMGKMEKFMVRFSFFRKLYFEVTFVELQPHCHAMGLNTDKCGCWPTVQLFNLTNNFKVTTGLYTYN